MQISCIIYVFNEFILYLQMPPKKYKSKGKATIRQKEHLAKARAARQPKTPPQATEATTSGNADVQAIPEAPSASKKKLGLFPETPVSAVGGLAIVDLAEINNLFSAIKCNLCQGPLQLLSTWRKGFVHKLAVRCTQCNASIAAGATSGLSTSDRCYETNKKSVAAFLNIGLGHAAMEKYCETMGIEGMTESSYRNILKKIVPASKQFDQSSLDMAVEQVRKAHGAKSKDDILDIAVSFDGTWHKRGHTSKHGVGIVIDVTTGLAIDFHVASTYCQVSFF